MPIDVWWRFCRQLVFMPVFKSVKAPVGKIRWYPPFQTLSNTTYMSGTGDNDRSVPTRDTGPVRRCDGNIISIKICSNNHQMSPNFILWWLLLIGWHSIPSLRSQAQWLFDFWLPENNLVILYKSKYLNKVKQHLSNKNILDSLLCISTRAY